MLSLEIFNNGQKLLIMRFISSFCRNYLFKKIYWILLTNFKLKKLLIRLFNIKNMIKVDLELFN